MRDVVAGVLALGLLFLALGLATRLRGYRQRRRAAADAERSRGRTIIAEIPASDDLVIVSEDTERFYYGERPIDKAAMTGVRVLINGSPIASYVSRRHLRGVPAPAAQHAGARGGMDEAVEGLLRDRWDVAIDTAAGTTLVECGAIRERVSQELARAIFDAVKREIERRDGQGTL